MLETDDNEVSKDCSEITAGFGSSRKYFGTFIKFAVALRRISAQSVLLYHVCNLETFSNDATE